MRAKRAMGFTLVFVLLLFYAGCKLLVEEKEDLVVNDYVQTGSSIEGEWVLTGTAPQEILSITANSFTSHRYQPEIQAIKTTAKSSTIDYKTNSIQFQTEGAYVEPYGFSMNGSELILTRNSQNFSYTRYTGGTTHSSWSPVPFIAGIMNNGAPSGTWIGTTENGEEVIRIANSQITLFHCANDTLFYKKHSFSVNGTHDTMIVQEENGTTLIPYSFDGSLEITNPEGSKSNYSPYRETQFPGSWNYNRIELDEQFEEMPDITGKWVEVNRNRVVEIFCESIRMIQYKPLDSIVVDTAYSLQITDDSLLMTVNGNTTSFTYFERNDTLFFNFQGGTWRFTKSTESLPLSHWKLKSEVILPVTGNWIIDDGTDNEIIEIGESNFKSSMYNPMDSIITSKTLSYELRAGGDSIYLKDGGNEVDKGEIIREINKITITLSNGVSKPYKRYVGKIPHDDWILQTGVKPSFQGSWLINDGSKREIMLFRNDTLISASYNPHDSTFRKDTMTYTYTMNNDSMHIFSDFINIGNWTISVGGTLLTVHKSDETTDIFDKYDGGIPHPEWILKTLVKNPLKETTWISEGSNPERIMVFENDSMKMWSYDYTDSVITTGTVAYLVETKPDSLSFIFPDEVMKVGFRIDGEVLVISDSDGESRYVPYSGLIPYSGWKEKEFHVSDYYGTWLFTSDSSEVMQISGEGTIAYVYDPILQTVDTTYYVTRFSSKADSIYFSDLDETFEIGYSISVSGSVLTINTSESYGMYAPYDGEIPLNKWVNGAVAPRYSRSSVVGMLKKLPKVLNLR